MESETKGLVHILSTLAAIEQVLLDIVTDSEQDTAGSIGCHVHPIGASDPPGEGSCGKETQRKDFGRKVGGKIRTGCTLKGRSDGKQNREGLESHACSDSVKCRRLDCLGEIIPRLMKLP